ncbi:MAG: hypothetical protein ACP5H3_01170 [Candidatus Aenigmatarchaeota archaeon]
MKKILILLILVALIPLALSQEDITIYAGETKTINYTISNLANEPLTYTVSLSGPIAYFSSKGIYLDVYPKILNLNPNQSAIVTLYITARKDAKETGSYAFSLDISAENQTISKTLIIRALRKYPVYISSLSLSKYAIYPLESLKIFVKVVNVKNEIAPNYKLTITISKDGKEIWKRDLITDFIEANSESEISQEFFAEKYQEAGTYEVYVLLSDLKGNFVDDAKTKFEVKPIVKLPEEFTEKEVKYSLLSAYVKIKIKNEGNVKSSSFYVEERVPLFMKDFFKPYVNPSEEKIEAGFITYRWLIPSLEPGQTVVIEYEISLWQTWIGLIVIIIAFIYFFRFTFRPALVKEIVKEGNKLKVYIKVKNKSKEIMKNIEIKEEVSPMLKIESFIGKEFEEKKVGKKRFLIWKIDELKPEEEALVGYRAEALVEVASITLPKTKVEFTDEKGRVRSLESEK